ncbi:MAG: cytochrome c biogenesis protein CcdA, partial [Candidatus Omnitrophica bacterium]|nr:cytochrome c biogenesis protein CcdA [Candidatus Omnitrophota bacterium]
MILSGSPLDYLWVFLGGIAASLSPCVYPLIPVTAGFIGVTSSGSRLRGLTLSLAYVTGIAITYSILGLIASLTGQLFGRISAHPLTSIIVGAIFILFGLSLLDLFALPLMNLVRLPALKKQNHLSSFILGLSSGLVIGPCVTPILGAILAFLVTRKNILYGVSMLLCFSYGLGLIFILVGTSS